MRQAFLIALVASFVGLGAAVADHGGRPFQTDLDGPSEVPGPGDPDGAGTVSLRLNPGQREVCFTLEVSNIVTATAAHIHRGAAGVAGPVVVTLTAPSDGSSEGCVEEVDRELIRDIIKNPENYYVNVHNGPFPAGAVRGQLGK